MSISTTPLQEQQLRPLPLCYYGDETLRIPCDRVERVTPEVRELADRMITTMATENGIGLAGPQVGRNVRLITVDVNPGNEPVPPTATPGERMLCPKMPVALLNPEILTESQDQCTFEEGCLSIPEINGDVVRPERILLRAMTLEGDVIQLECGGLLARCLQHEIDHLNGTLFVDRVSRETLEELRSQLKALEKRTLRRLRRRSRRT